MSAVLQQTDLKDIQDGGTRPLVKMCYQNLDGDVFYVAGFAVRFKEKDEEIVILSNLKNREVTYFPLAKFFDVAPPNHAKAGTPRFQLVTP